MQSEFYYKKDRLNQLRGFIATVQNDCCAIQASKVLNLESATIGKQIKSLERDLGFKLFDLTSNKRRILTEKGKMFYNEAVLRLQSIDGLFSSFSNNVMELKNNYIHFACHPNVAYEILPKAIKEFKKTNPDVVFKIEITPFDEYIKNLIQEKIDFMIFPTDNTKRDKKEIKYDDFYDDDLTLVMHKDHWLASKPENEITKEDIAKSNLVCMDEELFKTHSYLNFLLTDDNFVNNIIFKDANWEIVKSMIKENLCVAPISASYINSEDRKTLITKKISIFPSFRYCILSKKHVYFSPNAKKFIDLIKKITFNKINNDMEIKYNNKFVGELRIIPLDYELEEDFNIVKEIICDEEIMRTASSFNGSCAKNKKDIEYFLKMSTAYGKSSKVRTSKVLNSDGKIIGIIGIFTIKENENLKPEKREIENFLKKEYRNKHITTEISELLIENTFKKFPDVKIMGDNLVSNKVSQRILLKLGFKFKRKMINNNGAIINIFELDKNGFENRANNHIDIEKELQFIENFPESSEKVSDYIL